MEIIWLGHSAFEIISDENLKILIDPFISNNPACPFKVEEIDADLICVTHGHSDHFGDTMEIANRTGAVVIGNHEHSLYLAKQGFETIGMNIGGTIKIHNIKITMVNSNHSSDMDFIEEMGVGGSACGFIIQLESGTKIYHSGDTGVFGDMKDVIRDIYKPQIALIPIGDRYTMGPREASIAAQWLDPDIVIPMHYNTFPVIEQDPEEFADRVESITKKTKVVILEPGQIYKE
jgi:L-ascorbate metabolism protein UlaG (beta-lactamase superfamily)